MSAMKQNFIMETERLILRPHCDDDLSFMVELNEDPEVNLYTGDGPITKETARKILSSLTEQFQEQKMGRFVVIEKTTGETIGWCGLAFLQDRKVVDLGFRFKKSKWNLGYATESSLKFLEYGFNKLKLQEITAQVDTRNDASIRVLKKLNMLQSAEKIDEEGSYFDFSIKRENHREGE
jgi:RimJ/RimL family protein N-acetyltransferase